MSVSSLVRSASRIVPLATRASARCRWFSHRNFSSALSSAVNGRRWCISPQKLFPSFPHRYSTDTTSAESLPDSIKYEIECVTESLLQEETEQKVPEGFPFKIEDRVGKGTITLTREYQGETISVDVHMPDLVTGSEETVVGANQSSIPLVVKTSKKSGPYLEFSCTAFPDEIFIDSLSVKNPEMSEEQIAYGGPDFSDLDENLQKAMHRYLEIRGIKPSTTNFLHEYMIEKDTKEYVAWLKRIEKYLSA